MYKKDKDGTSDFQKFELSILRQPIVDYSSAVLEEKDMEKY